MIRRIFGIAIVAALLTSCGNNSATVKEDKNSEAEVKVEFASLIETPADFLNKEIVLDGNVVHVCTHSGKKMFVVGDNPDIRLHIAAGDDIPVFPMDLLGSTITVSGLLTEVIVAEEGHNTGEHAGEGEHAEESAAKKTPEGEDCETETALKEQPVLANYILQYKSHTVK